MKNIEVEQIEMEMKKKKTSNVDWKNTSSSSSSSSPPAPPPPPPLLPSYWIKPVKSITTRSVTNEEIAKFWRQKKLDEEDHLLAAIKAAARIRARNLTEEDYRLFEESLEDDNKEDESIKDEKDKEEDNDKEIRVGIKDWWTKSKYAYLNQPATETTEKPKKKFTYIPNFCYYKPPVPNRPPSFGVF